MYIAKLHIEGFGIFQNREFDLIPGLNVVFGPNEAGKTTLLVFLQHILFGFPDGRSRERTYTALRGGRLGGRVWLKGSKGQAHVVQRFSGKRGGELTVTCPDGSAGDEEDLANLLGHATRDVFCKIFAFGLGELQEFDTLKDEAVRSHIYSAGTGGIPISEIERQLSQEREKLFVPNGRKPHINKLLHDIEERRQILSQFSLASSEYDEALGRRGELRAQVEREQQEMEGLQKGLTEIQRLGEAWEVWRNLCDTESQLEVTEQIEDFPERGLEELERLQERQEELEARVGQLGEEEAILKRKSEGLDVDEDLLGQEDQIDDLISDRSKYESACTDLPKRKQELKSEEESLGESFRNLGSDWDEGRLSAFDGSIPVREEIRGYEGRLTQAEQCCHDAEREYQEEERRLKELSEDKASLQADLEGVGTVDEEALNECKAALRQVRNCCGEYRSLIHQREDLKVQGNRLRDLEGGEGEAVLPAWPGYALAALGVTGGVVVGSLFGLAGGIVVGLFALIIAGGYFYLQKKSGRGGTTGGLLEQQLRENQRLREDLEGKIDELEEAIQTPLAVLSLEDVPSEQEEAGIEHQLDEEAKILQRCAGISEQLRHTEERIEKREKAAEGAKVRAGEMQKALEDITTEWKDWLRKCGLQDTLSPQGTLEVLAEIRAAREKLKSVQSLRERVEEIQGFVEDYEGRFHQVCAACGRTIRSEGAVLGEVDRLQQDFEDAQTAERETHNIEEQLVEQEKRREQVEKRLEKLREDEGLLLKAAQAADCDEFRKKGDAYAQRQEYLNQQRLHRQSLERLVGIGEKYDRAQVVLQEKTPAELEEESAELGKDIQELGQHLREELEELGRLNKTIEDLESKEEAANLRLAQNAQLEQLNQQAREWAIWTISRTLMEEARRFYERERRPGVIKEAERFFTHITRDCYTHVLAPLDQEDLLVEDRIGRQKGMEGLSRGTAEQLYLALRMGLIREFGRKAEPLPVIMDDILVNFDSERAECAAEALGELARDHQVILLTCHQPSVELLQQNEQGLGRDLNLITLDREGAFVRSVRGD